jgi:RNA polymerase sigma-70 factor, ECF subfamily
MREMDAKIPYAKAFSVRGETWSLDLERELVERAKSGSADAFELLVTRYYARVFRVACNITHHDYDAEDVLQSAFLKAFNKLPLFRGDSTFYTWLVSITTNEALMKIRGRRCSREVLFDDSREFGDAVVADDVTCAVGPNPEQSCSHDEVRHILATAIDRLKPEQRMVFQLRHLQGLSVVETAEALNLTLPTVKTRLYRARRKLRRSLRAIFWSAEKGDDAGVRAA